MKGQLRIEEMYAFVATDTDGTEGIIGAPIGPGGSTMPLVGADMAMVEKLRPIARQLGEALDVPVTLARFSVRHDEPA